jgi:hypothetical protein
MATVLARRRRSASSVVSARRSRERRPAAGATVEVALPTSAPTVVVRLVVEPLDPLGWLAGMPARHTGW